MIFYVNICYGEVYKRLFVLIFKGKKGDDMARKDITSEKKTKPLTKKERKEQKKQRKQKHVSYE